jgi:hypothetical protein
MLLRCSKPSRWWQPPWVIRNLQPQRSPGATRCNHSSKCTWNHSQSHYDDESMIEMSGRCLLRLTRMLGMSKCQESHLGADPQLFIEPERNRAVALLRADRTRLTRRTPVFGRLCPVDGWRPRGAPSNHSRPSPMVKSSIAHAISHNWTRS